MWQKWFRSGSEHCLPHLEPSIGALLARYRCMDGAVQKAVEYYDSTLLAKLQILTGLPCLPDCRAVAVLRKTSRLLRVCIACQVEKMACLTGLRKAGGLIWVKSRDQSACLLVFSLLLLWFSRTFMLAGFYHFTGRVGVRFCSFTFFCRNCNRKCDLPVLILFERSISAVQLLSGIQPSIQKRL